MKKNINKILCFHILLYSSYVLSRIRNIGIAKKFMDVLYLLLIILKRIFEDTTTTPLLIEIYLHKQTLALINLELINKFKHDILKQKSVDFPTFCITRKYYKSTLKDNGKVHETFQIMEVYRKLLENVKITDKNSTVVVKYA